MSVGAAPILCTVAQLNVTVSATAHSDQDNRAGKGSALDIDTATTHPQPPLFA